MRPECPPHKVRTSSPKLKNRASMARLERREVYRVPILTRPFVTCITTLSDLQEKVKFEFSNKICLSIVK